MASQEAIAGSHEKELALNSCQNQKEMNTSLLNPHKSSLTLFILLRNLAYTPILSAWEPLNQANKIQIKKRKDRIF